MILKLNVYLVNSDRRFDMSSLELLYGEER
jgi:hypothetical protein